MDYLESLLNKAMSKVPSRKDFKFKGKTYTVYYLRSYSIYNKYGIEINGDGVCIDEDTEVFRNIYMRFQERYLKNVHTAMYALKCRDNPPRML